MYRVEDVHKKTAQSEWTRVKPHVQFKDVSDSMSLSQRNKAHYYKTALSLRVLLVCRAPSKCCGCTAPSVLWGSSHVYSATFSLIFWVSVTPSILNSTPHAALFGSVGSLLFLPDLCGYYSRFLVAAATQEILSQYTHTHASSGEDIWSNAI